MDALRKAVEARKRNLANSEDGQSRKNVHADEDNEHSEESDDSDSSSDSSSEESAEENESIGKADEADKTNEDVTTQERETSDLNKRAELTGTNEGTVLAWLDRILTSWLDELACRPEQAARTAQGRAALAAARESQEQIEPLKKALEIRSLDANILNHLVAIIHECDKREYRRAFDEYIKLTIGNAPWPIGVTMVGIHARSGREKIAESKVSHIMKDETARAYLTSVKRLMTRCQAMHPPDAPSKSMN